MDPLSITASVIAVLQLTGTVVSATYGYRQSVKNASKEAAQIIRDLTSLSEVLEQLLKLIPGGHSTQPPRLPTLELLNKSGGPLETCHNTLERLNEKLQPRTGWRALKHALTWPLKQDYLQKALGDISTAKATISFALQVDQTSLTQQTNDQVETLTADLRAQRLDERTAEQVRIMSPTDPSSNHLEACQKRQKGTCEWFLRSTTYKKWLNMDNTVLWISGIPGCGKTILCSAVIEDLLDKNDPTTSQTAVAYYYFNFQSTAEQQFTNMFRAIIAQLLHQSSDISDRLLIEIFVSLIKGFKRTFLVIDAFDECAQSQDALGWVRQLIEIKDSPLHLLISSRQDFQFRDTVAEASLSVVLLDEHVLANDIEAYIRQELNADTKLKRWPVGTKSDIERSLKADAGGLFRWVDCQLDRLRKCLRPAEIERVLNTPPKTLDEMYDRIVAGIDEAHFKDAYRVLQWVAFATRPLRTVELNDALAFVETDPDEPVFAAHLRLAFLEDVLSLCSSLVHSSVESGGDLSDPIVKSPEVRLAHKSVKDYLVSRPIDVTSSTSFAMNVELTNSVLAKCCLAYLIQLNSQLDMQTVQDFPLAQYAARSWTKHYQDCGDISVSALDRLTERFLGNTTAYENSYRLFNPERHWQGINLDIQKFPTPLYCVSLAGLCRMISALVSSGVDPNEPGLGDHGDPLRAAAYGGNVNCVRALLSAGANLDGTDEPGLHGSPMASAASRGHVAVVEELLGAGASMESKDRYEDGSALWEALYHGQVTVAKLLLCAGADVNVSVGYSGVTSVIELAYRLGNPDLMCMMLPKLDQFGFECTLDAIVERKDRPLLERYVESDRSDRGRKAGLEYASRGGYSDLVQKLLVDDPQEAEGRNRDTLAFEEAASSGSLETVQVLYEDRPVDGVTLEELSKGILRAASLGHTLVVVYLLDRGADVTSQACRQALVEAAAAGYLSTVQTLLSAGVSAVACSNYEGSQGMSCLWAAVDHQSIGIARLLVQHGADAETYFDGVSALMKTIEFGDDELFDFLLEKGASIENARTQAPRHPIYDTLSLPMQFAAASGSVRILRHLLEAGHKADEPTIQDGWTALYFAARAGHAEIIKILIHEHGVDASQRTHGGTVAIHTAAYHDHATCVEVFLDAGVDIDIRGRRGRTALIWAVEMGSVDATRVLLDRGADTSISDQETGMSVIDVVHGRLANVRERPHYFRELRGQDEKEYGIILNMLQDREVGQEGGRVMG